MWGEVVNGSNEPVAVAVIRGVLLYDHQAAGYGLQELQNLPPKGRSRFNFYCYQLALESAPKPNAYQAMVIPGYHLSEAFKQLGEYGMMLEEILRASGF